MKKIVLFLFFGFVVYSKNPNFFVYPYRRSSSAYFVMLWEQGLETPNIDSLAKSGIVLDQAYHMGSMSGAVCSPSRTMIMTGRTLWHLPPRGKKHLLHEVGETLNKDILQNTLPAVFNRAGYETFRTCKKGNSYSQANELFHSSEDKTSRKAGPMDGSQWHGRQILDFLDLRSKKKTKAPFLCIFGIFSSA